MIKTFTNFFLLFFGIFLINACFSVALAQTRIISFQINDDLTKEPLIQATVAVKGTNNGTVTDENGMFSIEASVGNILVISYAGYEDREFLVTEKSVSLLNAEKHSRGKAEKNFVEKTNHTLRPIHSYAEKDSVAFDYRIFSKKNIQHKRAGEVNFQEESISIKDTSFIEKFYKNAEYIQKIKVKDGKIDFKYNFLGKNYYHTFKNLSVEYTGQLEASMPNKTPNLQNKYAQGTQNTWQKDSPFSYGAEIKSLVYDTNQNLVPASNNTGTPALTHNALNLLQTSIMQSHHIKIASRWQKNAHSFQQNTTFHYQNTTGILSQNIQNYYALASNINYQQHQLNFRASKEQQNLPLLGANWQNIMAGIYGNSPSFDPSKTFAQQIQVPDKNTNEQIAFTFSPHIPQHRFTNRRIYINFNTKFGGNFQNKNNLFGVMPQMVNTPQGRLSERNIVNNTLFGQVGISFDGQKEINFGVFEEYTKIKVSFDYYHEYQNTTLNRQDAFGFVGKELRFEQAQQSFFTKYYLERSTHLPSISLDFDVDDAFFIKGNVKKYHSSTLDNQAPLDNVYYSIGSRWYPFRVWNILYNSNISSFTGLNEHFAISANYSTNPHEAPLLYNQYHFNSLQMPISQFRSYYENTELTWHKGLSPEILQKFNVGIDIEFSKRYHSSPFKLNFNYFQHNTQNMILPIARSNVFGLENAINLRNRGWELELEFKKRISNWRYYRDTDGYEYYAIITSKLSISRYNPIVTKIHTGQSNIPITGYQEISTQAIEGQPLGVIVGSAYLRDEQGRKIIDVDGFPKVNPTPQILGNQNPDFIMVWLNEIQNNVFGFSVSLEYRHGGYVWNGTQNALNYWGTSQQSAQERNITNYVFSGVNPNGQPNTIAVDFANPNLPFGQNRFVRYGLEGVGEDALVRATSLRIREICFSQNLRKFLFSQRMRNSFPRMDMIFKLYASNILLYAPNFSSDPQTSLMNYSLGTGLDFMNAPATSQMGCKLFLKF